MAFEVQGKVLLYSAMSLGALMTEQMKEFLKTVKPEEYYPGDLFKQIVEVARVQKPHLLHGAGKTWGQVQKPVFLQMGIKTVHEALVAAAKAAEQGSFRGFTGNRVEITGPNEAIVHECSGLPQELYSAIWEGHVIAWGGTDVKVEASKGEGSEMIYRLSWK